MNHRIFERKLRSRGLTPREHVRLSAASIYPFNKSHSTHTHPPTVVVVVVVELGERALPPPPAVAWPQIVYGEIVLPQHTHRYTYYIVCARLSCVVVVVVGVGRSVGCVCFVYGLLLSTHPV